MLTHHHDAKREIRSKTPEKTILTPAEGLLLTSSTAASSSSVSVPSSTAQLNCSPFVERSEGGFNDSSVKFSII